MEYYAHSGIIEQNILPQKYPVHISSVCSLIERDRKNIKTLEVYYHVVALISGFLHDSGKISEYIQPYLNRQQSLKEEIINEKLLNHVDLGVAICHKLYKETNKTVFMHAAIYCYCHHIGLINIDNLIKRDIRDPIFSKEDFDFNQIRDNRVIKEHYNIPLNMTVAEYNNSTIDESIAIIKKLNPKEFKLMMKLAKKTQNKNFSDLDSSDFKMGMSIFVDADHTDTEVFYGGNIFYTQDRIQDATSIVAEYPKSFNAPPTTRNKLRNELLKSSLKVNRRDSYFINDGPVGSGKTIAIMASSEKLCDQGNIKVVYVSPFNNINEQTFNVYSKVFNIPNDFYCVKAFCTPTIENSFLRKFSYKLLAPVTITSGVNFIETALSERTSDIRLFKYLTNTVIVLDEYHLLNTKVVSVFLDIIKGLSKHNTKCIFSSGTPCNFWETFNKGMSINRIINTKLINEMTSLEKDRITYHNETDNIKDFNALFKHIMNNRNKSTLVVMNTRRNAYKFSKMLENKHIKAFHISNNMIHSDVANIIAQVKESIKNGESPILVGTNLIECGYDISFQIGYKELASYPSIIQCGGRVNRNCEGTGDLYIFITDQESSASKNRKMDASISICKKYINEIDSNKVSEVVEEEINLNRSLTNRISYAYEHLNYKMVALNKAVIDHDTIKIIIDNDHSIEEAFKVGVIKTMDIMKNSISLHFSQRQKLIDEGLIREVKVGPNDSPLLFWIGPYNTTYGISEMLYKDLT